MSNQEALLQLRSYINRLIIGQEKLVERLLIALLADGHLLVEGAPGLAKTRAIRVLGEGVEADFHRVQFTPDLLPADLTGTEIFRQQTGEFEFRQGPLFHNLVLADEINRAPAKVQSALLEAMAERQITIGRVTYPLPPLFLVMATQNPIEQDGTYPLPEAQLDRFLLHLRIDYPGAGDERNILRLARSEAFGQAEGTVPAPPKISQSTLFAAREEVLSLYMAENLEEYLVQLILATRNPGAYGEDLAHCVRYGASPRATIALDRCARAHAWLAGRDYVAPEDIQAMAPDVLRHRVLLSYEAEVEGMTVDRFTSELMARVAVP
ncbi:MAG: AAA family ATPase [Desulfuromonas sp.]|uniref:AAA family ATPase n=1 Tax=Desulfuromonas sp. TaxID=892 RepID=UPI000CC1F7C6|nr:MoxR family ATPase [Desulfuromonas sp.]PLX81671.1 MAG: AAA family ATPase [Desulfuromonas sp.]